MKFTLEQNHKSVLEKLANSGMTSVIIAHRAKILLMKADGKSATAITEVLGISRHTAVNSGCRSTHSRHFRHIATGGKHANLHKSTFLKKEECLCSRRRG